MAGPDGGPVEAEDAAALEDPVDDGLREVLVVEDAAQAGRSLLVVMMRERFLRWRSWTTWNSRLAASSPQAR